MECTIYSAGHFSSALTVPEVFAALHCNGWINNESSPQPLCLTFGLFFSLLLPPLRLLNLSVPLYHQRVQPSPAETAEENQSLRRHKRAPLLIVVSHVVCACGSLQGCFARVCNHWRRTNMGFFCCFCACIKIRLRRVGGFAMFLRLAAVSCSTKHFWFCLVFVLFFFF